MGYGASGSNLYAFGHGDPVNHRDPTGEDDYDDKLQGYIRWYMGQQDAMWKEQLRLDDAYKREVRRNNDVGPILADRNIVETKRMTFGGGVDNAALYIDAARAHGDRRVLSMSFEQLHGEILKDEAVRAVPLVIVGTLGPHVAQSEPINIRRAVTTVKGWVDTAVEWYSGSILSSEVGAVGPNVKNVPRINGRRPINSRYAGDQYPVERLTGDLAEKYPKGVAFNEEGFAVFSPYAKARVKVNGLTGQYAIDEALANQAVGLPSTPSGYVWHHVEDGVTMELIPADIHGAVRHTGGAAKLRGQK